VMDRRTLLTGWVCLLTPPLTAEAQGSSEVRRVGYLQADVSGLPSAFYEILRQGLRDLGYVEGRNLLLEHRFTDDRSRLGEMAAELVRLNVEVIGQQAERPPAPVPH
jgi:putative ABC transport system substrate-binding protein